jgi:hypothetical protein
MRRPFASGDIAAADADGSRCRILTFPSNLFVFKVHDIKNIVRKVGYSITAGHDEG